LPDDVRIEQGFPDPTLDALRAMGHRIAVPLGQTSANSIFIDATGFHGAADPRTRGATAAGH
jgi:gamma-glutamyltranspeptidase/glutathione hydrolase